MTTDIARLEREIAAERAELLANLALLEDRARALTDWRRQVRKRPLIAVGAAAVGGLLLAMMAGGRARTAASERSEGVEGSGDARRRRRSHPLIDRIVSTLAVVAAERAFAALGINAPATVDASTDVDASQATGERGP